MGRGIASSGRTCGRGHSGQNSRSGPKRVPGFAGGQTPLHLAIPKIGKPSGVDKRLLVLVNLGRVERLIRTGRIDPAKPITIKTLYDAGIKDCPDGIKICARVSLFVCMPLSFMPVFA